MSQREVVLLLGSNLGDPKKNVESAINIIERQAGTILSKSEFLSSEPAEFASSNIFCNIALLINTQFSPIKLLNLLKKIERGMGRKADSRELGGYTDRVIDIDIVSFGGLSFRSERLEIPHIRHLEQRDFSQKLIKQITQIKKQL